MEASPTSSRSEQPRGAEKRRRILNAALKLLLSSGMSTVTHRAVATQAEVPPSSIRYYFSTREELLVACMDDMETQRAATAAKILAANPARDAFSRNALHFWLGPNIEDSTLIGTVASTMDSLRESPILAERLRSYRQTGETDLRALATSCGLRDLDVQMMTAVCDGTIMAAGAERLDNVAERAIAAIETFVQDSRIN
ncbi:TetR/AcrR family transcriptional regulator [Corynebacterium sp. A21]|uniref:TetR/AcrR family transcriptional regulator n=1 Tax=Corynebacterium sp. A21 TaxID=3457318 RepID=UPI003FD57729